MNRSVGWCGVGWKNKEQRGRLTAWPRLRGWMSRKAKTLSLSKSLKDGMSPVIILV